VARLAVLAGIVVALVSLAGFGASAAPAQTVAAGGIDGTVKDDGGRPVAGASLLLTGPRTYAATTDSQGRYAITNVEPGTYSLRVAKGGYQPASQLGLLIASGGLTHDNVTLTTATLQTIASVKSYVAGPHFNTTPAAVNVVTSQAFENQAQTQVMQVLNQVPGVQISFGGVVNGAAPGSVQVPTIRGASSYETASLIDGHPFQAPTFGDFITTYLSSFMFGSVEIVKGPGADAVEVNNAINGTINFRTKDPTAQPVPDYEVGFTTNGGTYANIGLTDTELDGRLGYVFDVAVVNEPSAINGKNVLIDPSNGYFGSPTGKQLSGSATYSNVGNTESNIQTGYSLLACCYTLYGDFNNTSELVKLRYRISPSTVATVSYLDGQTFTDQNDNLANLTSAQFMPPSNYSGSLRAGPQQVTYLYPGAPNNLVNLEPVFQAEVSSAIGKDTILARYYHASLYRETQQGTGPDVLDPYYLTIYGSSSGFKTPFNGVTAPIFFSDYFNESELDKLGGWSFEYDHPFGENTLSFSFDQSTTQATAYEIEPTYVSVSIPQGSSQLFTTLQLHANLQLTPTVSAMLADYQNVYRSTYAGICPYSGGFTNCAIDGAGVGFTTTTTGHNDPRAGLVWRPQSNLSVRLAAGSAIAPPYLDLLSQPTAPFATYDPQTRQATLVKNSGQLLPETAFGYDLGSDYRLKDSWTVLSGDVYENNLFNHYFGETLYSGLTCGMVTYPCLEYGSIKAPPSTPIYYMLNTNISNFRFEGIEMQLQRIPPIGWGFTLAGALQKGYVYNLPPYFYCSSPGPHCQYNQNLNIIANQNINGEGIGSVSYSPYFGFGSTIGSLNTRIPYAQGNVAVSYTFRNHAFVMLGTTYYGNNNSLNEPPFGYGYFTVRYPFTRTLSLQISGNNIWNAWPGVIPVYGEGVAIPLANGGTAATLGNVLGPATWTLLVTKGFGT
jgi:hypothetical protein